MSTAWVISVLQNDRRWQFLHYKNKHPDTYKRFYSEWTQHYSDIIMGAITSQITSITNVYSTDYSDAGQRKHQSSASLAFVWAIHRFPVNSPHKWSVTREIVSIWWRDHEYCCALFCVKIHVIYIPTGLILGSHPANESRHYKVTLSLIGWAQT